MKVSDPARRRVWAYSLSQGTLLRLDEFVEKVAQQPALAAALQLPNSNFTLDKEGMVVSDYQELARLAGIKKVLHARNYVEELNSVLRAGGDLRAALQYMNRAKRDNGRKVRSAERVLTNASRIVEALLLVGMETLENAGGGGRPQKSLVSKNGHVAKTEGKRADTKARKVDAVGTADRTASTAA